MTRTIITTITCPLCQRTAVVTAIDPYWERGSAFVDSIIPADGVECACLERIVAEVEFALTQDGDSSERLRLDARESAADAAADAALSARRGD